MLIPVTCPYCETTYQLQPELRGQAIRCPNALCQEIFVVQDAATAKETPGDAAAAEPPAAEEKLAPPQQISGSVGEIVPIVPAEEEQEQQQPIPPVRAKPKEPAEITEPPAEPPKPPPPVREKSPEEEKPQSEETPEVIQYTGPTESEPVELPAGMWKEPPVRARKGRQTEEEETQQSRAEVRSQAEPGNEEETAKEEARQSRAEMRSQAEPGNEREVLEEERRQSRAEVRSQAEPGNEEEMLEEPEEGLWEAPPVRRTGEPAEESVAAETVPMDTGTAGDVMMQPGVSRKTILLLGGLLGFVVLLAGGVFWLFQSRLADVEEMQRQKAEKMYDSFQFADAAKLYEKLEEEYPDSEHQRLYEFRRQLALAREPIYTTQTEAKTLAKAVEQFKDYLQQHLQDSQLAKHQDDVWKTLYRAAVELGDFARRNKDRDLLEQARKTLEQTENYKAPEGINSAEQLKQARDDFQNVATMLTSLDRRHELLQALKKLAGHPQGNIVQRSRELVASYAKTQPELAGDAEVLKLLGEMPALHRESIKYTSVARPARTEGAGDSPASMYFTLPLRKGRLSALKDSSVVLALDNGILYALKAQTGDVQWARRVGLDTAALPVRVPQTPTLPERLLVLSSDQQTLSAVVADSGKTLWQQQLPSPCLGQPVLLGRRAYIACYEGGIQEIDLPSGQLLGFYATDQKLTGWGSQQSGTSRFYFPAESYCIYVLDVARRKCIDILYTKHPAGSVRGKPILIDEWKDSETREPFYASSGWLVFLQADGMDHLQLRVLPLGARANSSEQRKPLRKLTGWTCSPPLQTPEHLALVTDAGQFVAFGMNREDRQQEPLFARFEDSFSPSDNSPLPPRAQVVYGENDAFWVLVHGRLHKLQAGFFRDRGPRLLPPWLQPISLGSPLHASQIRRHASGPATMFIVTRELQDRSVRASALKADDGSILWQHELGLFCKSTPVAMDDKIVSVDPDGHVCLFDSRKFKDRKKTWYDGNRLLAKKLPAEESPLLVMHQPESRSVFVLAGTNQGNPVRFHLRQIKIGKKIKSIDRQFTVQAPLNGTPAVGQDALLLPLDNGILVRCPFSGEAPASGPSWRALHADTGSAGHVLWLGSDKYLYTDGSRKIIHIQWSEGNTWEQKDSLELSRRIARPPVLMKLTKGNKSPLVALADAEQRISLVQLEPLKLVRSWPMPGEITAGPFIRGNAIGCIVDHRHLFLMDIGKKEPLWKHTAPARIVGEPQLIDGKLIVADHSGRIVALDRQTGKTDGAGQTLQTSAVPATTPIRWTQNRLFVPLMDGTVMFLPMK